MSEILTKSMLIKNEADVLLNKYQLIKILERYGNINFTGSYELDLMYKKDIDISLINDDLSVPEFSQLGKELIDTLNTPSVYYRNTRITPVDKRPENALYWGINTGEWWIDLWAMSNSVFTRADEYIRDIKSKLNDQSRILILELKAELMDTQKYGKDFGSRELYDAVLNHRVKNIEMFNNYLENNRGHNKYL